MTANSEKDLCPSCSYVTQRTDSAGVTRECTQFGGERNGRVYGRVIDCSDYYPKALPSLYDMHQIAWEITTNKKTGKLGFITPAERKRIAPESEAPEWER